MKRCRRSIALTLCILAMLVIPAPYIAAPHAQGLDDVNRYSYVISNWLNWIVKVDLYTQTILEIGSIATINTSITVIEKGSGELLSITSFSVTIGRISVSNYVGIFTKVGDEAHVSIDIPVSTDSPLRPGATVSSTLQFALQGYVEFANGSRKQLMFSQIVPVTLFLPPSPVVASINAISTGNGAILQIRIDNFDVQPVYKVYANIYINSSLFKSIPIEYIPKNSSTTLSYFASLEPGVYIITANVSYITSYGMTRTYFTTTKLVIPLKPNILIKTNATNVIYTQSLLLSGCTTPRARLGIVLEYSLNGFEWSTISSVESNETGCFYFTWRPSVIAETVYVRARSIATELYQESTSNVITLSISKLVPVLRISTNSTSLRIGDPYPKILITVDPPMPLTVTIMYREAGLSTWSTYAIAKTDDRGRAIIPPQQFFSEPGTYIFKAIAPETNTTASAESNEISIVVQQIQQTISTQSQVPQQPQGVLGRVDVMKLSVVLALSIAIALLLFATGKRKLCC